MADLFQGAGADGPDREDLAPGAVLLRAFALVDAAAICAAVEDVAREAPFRHMVTPGGFEMSVAMTNCGTAGWVTDRKGYRYAREDPATGRPWPAMPSRLADLARRAAAAGGYDGFVPDACLVNRYVPGARMSLHQDKDEADFDQPIVSLSLGLPATFQFGGAKRSDPTRRVALRHGDVLVWGGPSRLNYHGVLTLKDGEHSALGRQRLNLTLRKAL